MAYLDSEYEEFISSDGSDVSGNVTKRSPELSTNLVLQYQFLLNSMGTIVVRGEHQYQSQVFFTEKNERLLSQPGYHHLNAKVTYTNSDGRISISAFAKNLTDEESINVAVDLQSQFGEVIRSYNPPRTYGAEIAYHF